MKRNFQVVATMYRRGFLLLSAALVAAGAGAGEESREPVFEMRPIGRVRNVEGKPVQLRIFGEYAAGLEGLEHCSQVMVIWWFDKNDTPEKRKVLAVHPCGNPENPLTGVFATRSPMRPNLVAVTTCKVISVEGGIVTIDGIDAFDGTPILDLKCDGTRDVPLKGRPPGAR